MALDVPVDRIISLAGHDGSCHPWPAPFSLIREGFHIHEMIDVAYLYFRRLLCPFVRTPMVTPDENCPEQLAKFRRAESVDHRWCSALYCKVGIMTGQMTDTRIGHAVAWDGHRVYDPRGYVYRYSERLDYKYDPDTFWMLGGYDGDSFKILS